MKNPDVTFCSDEVAIFDRCSGRLLGCILHGHKEIIIRLLYCYLSPESHICYQSHISFSENVRERYPAIIVCVRYEFNDLVINSLMNFILHMFFLFRYR